MIHQFDHRAASVLVNEKNLHNPAISGNVRSEQKLDPQFSPLPQYWVSVAALPPLIGTQWTISFRDIARPTDERTMIATVIPSIAAGNTLPLILPEKDEVQSYSMTAFLLLANLNAIVCDYVARQKIQGTHLNWYIVEQLPVIPPNTYASTKFGAQTAVEIVREAVLELTYTATDMAPFARDMGYVDANGIVKAPFTWNDDRRSMLRAKLDAVHFLLYGITDRDDVRYIYSTFPIVEREETREHGRYLSRDLCLAWMNALKAGHADADIKID